MKIRIFLQNLIILLFIHTSIIASHDAAWLSLYFKPAEKKLFTDLDSCNELAYIALQHATNDFDKASCYRLLGRVLLYTGKYAEARATFKHGFSLLYEKSDTSLLKLSIKNSIASTFMREKNFDLADSIYREISDSIGVISSYSSKLIYAKIANNRGEVCFFKSDLDNAKSFLDKALKIISDNNYSTSYEFLKIQGLILENLGRYYEILNKKELAYNNYKQSYAIRKLIVSQDYFEFIQISLKMIFFLRENPEYLKTDHNDYTQGLEKYWKEFSTEALIREVDYFNITIALDQKIIHDLRTKHLIQIFFLVLISFLILFFFVFSRREVNVNKLTLTLTEIFQFSSPQIKDLTEIIERFYEKANQVLDAPVISLGIYNKETNYIEFYVKKSYDHLIMRSIFYGADNNIYTKCFQNEERYVNRRIKKSENFSTFPEEDHIKGPLFVSPLLLNGVVLGVISVQRLRKRMFSKKDMFILDSLTNILAVIVNNFLINRSLTNSIYEKSTIFLLLMHEAKTYTFISTVGLQALKSKLLIDKDHQKAKTFELLEESIQHQLDLFNNKENFAFDIQKLNIAVSFNNIVPSVFFENITNHYYHLYDSYGIKVKLSLRRSEPFSSDITILSFILRNMITNACKSIQKKTERNKNYEGHIEIIADVDKDKKLLYLQVNDNGMGLSEGQAESLFSSKISARGSESGTGVALQVCRKMISIYNGYFTNNSEILKYISNIEGKNNPDHNGCSFFLTLPIVI